MSTIVVQVNEKLGENKCSPGVVEWGLLECDHKDIAIMWVILQMQILRPYLRPTKTETGDSDLL